MDAMFECPRIPGHLMLMPASCAKSWKDGNGKDVDKRIKFHYCTRCPIGAKNAGCDSLSVVNPYFMRKRCPRCDRPCARMIGGRVCVSCYNREREVLNGRDGRGKVPKSLPMVRPYQVAAVVNGHLRSVRVAYAADGPEAVLQVLRNTSGEVVFGFHPQMPVMGCVQMRLW